MSDETSKPDISEESSVRGTGSSDPKGSLLRAPSGGAPDVAEAAPEENLSEPPPILDSDTFDSMAKTFYEQEETETKLYNVNMLNATFAIMSLVLLFLTVWAIWQDYNREWKQINYEWFDYEAQQLQKKVAAEQSRIQKERSTLLTEIDKQERQIDNPATRGQRHYVNNLKSQAKIAETETKFFKANLDTEKFRHEKAIEEVLHQYRGETEAAGKEIAELEKIFHEAWIEPFERLQAAQEKKERKASKASKSLEEQEKKRDELTSRRDSLVREVGLLEANLRKLDASAGNTIRNWPLLDFFAPSAKIHKAVLEDLTEPLNFLDVPRVDRCKSCHLNIDSPVVDHAHVSMENSPHGGKVFRSHPRLDLFVGSASPHPYQEFGCTICHYGDPRALSFTTASHTPEDKHEAHEWENKYHWHKMHHQDYPMLPMKYISSTCSKCHTEESRIQGANKWNEGRQLVERYGCFGCHKLKGFEDYKKVGPNLKFLTSKVKSDFLYKWIRDPVSFRSTTLMPQFFGLDNNQGDIDVIGEGGESQVHDFMVRNDVEALAIATYLGKTSEKLDNLWTQPENLQGDVARGEQVFRESGCAGCHSIESRGIAANDFAPDLGGTGSKINPKWLFDWIINPSHHDPETQMPRLRIEQDEGGHQKVTDLVAFLTSLTNPEFEQEPEFVIDDAARQTLRDIAYTNYRQAESRLDTEARLAKAYADGNATGDQALLNFVGEKSIARYGCFGCHDGIKGFENAQPIGAELSKHGNKAVDRLDYGHWGHQSNGEYAVGKTRIAWFTKKLQNTRMFDMIPAHTVDKDGHSMYESTDVRMAKAPDDLLKMPLFKFHDDQDKVDAVVTFLLGNLPDPIPPQKMHKLDSQEKAIEKGNRITRDLNCKGCHRLGSELQEWQISDLPRFSFDDPEEATERNDLQKETWLAEKVVLEAKPEEGLDAITFPKATFLSQLFRYNGPREDDEYSVIEILEYYWEKSRTPESDRIVSLHGLDEGRVRQLFGKGAEDRPKAPPLLRLEGDRVHGDWLFNFLLNVQSLRPWLSIRMPSYNMSPEESEAIVSMFRALSEEGETYERFASHTLNASEAAHGQKLFKAPSEVEGGLGCNSCHPAGDQMPASPDKNSWGPNLALARERLRPDWLWAWLISPNNYMPGTKMPAFWLQPDAFLDENPLSPSDRAIVDKYVPFLKDFPMTKSLDSEWTEDMRGIIQYLMHMNEIDKN